MQIGNSSPMNVLFSGIAKPKPGKPDPAASAAQPSAPSFEASKPEPKSAQEVAREEIRQKGFFNWAQDQRLEKMKEKVRAQVIAANPDADEATIAAEVARRIKEIMEDALRQEAERAAKTGEPARPMVVAIKV